MPHAVHHRHFSAKELRRLAGVKNREEEYLCPTCGQDGVPGKMHFPYPTDRLKVCVSSSTLHEYWRHGNYAGDTVHIDYCTIPGAKIQDLALAWRADYRHEKRPMDVVCVAGLNNIKLESEDRIMERIDSFARTVRIQSENYHPESPSTFTFATMFLPPQFTRFPRNGRHPDKNFQIKLK